MPKHRQPDLLGGETVSSVPGSYEGVIPAQVTESEWASLDDDTREHLLENNEKNRAALVERLLGQGKSLKEYETDGDGLDHAIEGYWAGSEAAPEIPRVPVRDKLVWLDSKNPNRDSDPLVHMFDEANRELDPGWGAVLAKKLDEWLTALLEDDSYWEFGWADGSEYHAPSGYDWTLHGGGDREDQVEYEWLAETVEDKVAPWEAKAVERELSRETNGDSAWYNLSEEEVENLLRGESAAAFFEIGGWYWGRIRWAAVAEEIGDKLYEFIEEQRERFQFGRAGRIAEAVQRRSEERPEVPRRAVTGGRKVTPRGEVPETERVAAAPGREMSFAKKRIYRRDAPWTGRVQDLDSFTRSYLEAALFTGTDDNDEPLDKNYGIDDFAPGCLAQAVRECAAFGEVVTAAGFDWGNIMTTSGGHDFWLTRNHHGAGFWDGDWGEDGDALSEIAQGFSEVWLHVGDDGRIHCSGGTEPAESLPAPAPKRRLTPRAR